jgi:hypothetical protein
MLLFNQYLIKHSYFELFKLHDKMKGYGVKVHNTIFQLIQG